MNSSALNSAFIKSKSRHQAFGNCIIPVKVLALVVLFLFSSSDTFAQNTKGDRPAGTSRENRFKVSSKKPKKSKSESAKRVRPKEKSSAAIGRSRTKRGEKAGKPIKPTFSQTKPRPSEQKAWKGDLTGRRIRTKGTESSARNVHPQQGRYVRKNIPDQEQKRARTAGARRVTVRSRSARDQKIYTQNWKYIHNPSSKPKETQRVASNRSQLARLNRLQSGPPSSPPGKKKIVPRSASRSYIARKSTNVYAHFPRQKRKPEQAHTKDLAGRPLYKRNYESPKSGVIKPSFQPYYGRKRVGDRPYSGPAAGKYKTATKPGERAWTGDIAKRQVRHRNRSSKKSVEGRPMLSQRPRSATRSGEGRPGLSAIPVRIPKSKAAAKVAGYPGNLRRYQVQPGFSNQGEEFSGHIKAKRPLKGGGSVSGKLWNNNERPLVGKTPKGSAQIGGYQGNIKAKRPEKGGGSVSGKLWNNNERPIEVRTPKRGAQIAGYQGNLKAKRPEKGGGSVSGKLWNNYGQPIPVKTPPARARKEGEYPGNLKRFEVHPGFQDQGEEFTGYIKLSRFKRNYIQNKKAADESIKKRRPEKTVYAVEGLQVKMKRRDYVRNKNSADDALLKLKPTETTRHVADLQVKAKRRPYVKNPNSADEALLKLKPTKTTQQVNDLHVKVKQYHYRHNPSSAAEALKVREPGRAFAKATDYQGNIKMQKFRLFEKNRNLHPDARFVRTNKNNVKEEKDMLTNFKLWWARLFRKQETQPEHLKTKIRKPRYDKGEQGLWYD